MGKIKDTLIEEYKSAPYKVGDWVKVPESYFDDSYSKSKIITGVVVDVIDDNYVKVCDLNREYKTEAIVPVKKCEKDLYRIGANPFPEKPWNSGLQSGNYTLEGILYFCGILEKDCKKEDKYVIKGVTVPEINWNPYVFDREGNKRYYQRDFCWTLKDEQLFIESIYQNLNCGRIIVRNHSWGEVENQIVNGNTEVAFRDIVDGKQRLHTLSRFVNDEFADLHGNYFSDLSKAAWNKFMDSSSVGFAQFGEGTTDEQTIEAFLNVNFTGIPMSQEHIDYVKEIQKTL